MRSQWLFTLAAILVLAGIIFIVISWHGTVSVTGAFPTSSSSVQLSGAANGGAAVLGLVSLLAGLILMIFSIIRAIMEPFRGNRRTPPSTATIPPTTPPTKPTGTDPYSRP